MLELGNDVVPGAKCECGWPYPKRITVLVDEALATVPNARQAVALIVCACGIAVPLPLKPPAPKG
jgi:hypothetical protein